MGLAAIKLIKAFWISLAGVDGEWICLLIQQVANSIMCLLLRACHIEAAPILAVQSQAALGQSTPNQAAPSQLLVRQLQTNSSPNPDKAHRVWKIQSGVDLQLTNLKINWNISAFFVSLSAGYFEIC